MFNINSYINKPKEDTYFEYYKIERDNSLFEVAKNKNVNPNLLAILNGLDPSDYVYKEQVIMVPKKDYSYYITKEGDTLEIAAQTFNTNVSNLIKNNQIIYLQEGQLLVNKVR